MARPEDRLQVRCAMLATSHVLKPCRWTAIEHGRQHSGSKEQRAREWGRLARKGVKKGISDFWFIVPGFLLSIELKWAKNEETEAQEQWGFDLKAMGHGYEVARSVEQFGEHLERHGIPIAPGWRVAAMRHDAALETPPKGHNKPPRATKPRAPRGNHKQVARWNTAMLAMAKGPHE